MAEVAAEGAAVAHRVVRDGFISFRQQRAARPDQRRMLDVVVPGERADGDAVAILPDVAQVGDAVDVDQAGGLDEPEIHHGNQALAARQNARVGVVGERLQRVVDARSPQVAEWCGFHGARASRTARFAITPTRCAR